VLRLLAFISLSLSSFAGAFTFTDFQNLVSKPGVDSIEAVLAHLPEDYRSKYVLMFESRSLQQGSFTNPRVLMFGNDAQFIISFNGAKDQRGYDALETMEFDPLKNQFNYREVLFPKKDSSDRSIKISEVNTARCTKCHGDPARPVWDSHPIWPGAYGEKYLSPLSKSERKGIQDFLAEHKKHERYKFLVHAESFAKDDTFLPTAKERYDSTDKESPNTQLSRLLSDLNARRVAKIITQNPDFPKVRYAVLASLDSDCGDWSNDLPTSQKENFLKNLANYRFQSAQKNREQQRLKNGRMASVRDGSHAAVPLQDQETLDEVRFIFDEILHSPTELWSTALEANTSDFTAPLSFRSKLRSLILKEVEAQDPVLREMENLRKISSSEKFCSLLAKKAVAGLAKRKFDRPSGDVQVQAHLAPALVAKCMNCHETGVGPFIPFSQPQKLSELLTQGHYARGTLKQEIQFRLSSEAASQRMPLGMNISDEQAKELQRYFENLAISRTGQSQF
jgi:cytochrome c553